MEYASTVVSKTAKHFFSDGQRATEGATISSPNFDTKVTTPTGTAIVETNSPVSPGTLLSYTVSQPLRVSTGDRELEVPEDGSNFLLVEINMTLVRKGAEWFEGGKLKTSIT